MVDSVYRTRSLGVAAEGLPDQYADGEAAQVWQLYIGDTRSRTAEYKSWLLGLLQQHGCQHVLDVACGTGVDSIMLVEEGFRVTSVDASDKMLKYALKERWNRRHEEAFDKWVIEEANWLTLDKDVPLPAQGGFDAVICLGNSFAHLPDCKGDQSEHKLALKNIVGMVRPGGLLVIDHRNYDHILSTGCAPPGKNIYYKRKQLRPWSRKRILDSVGGHLRGASVKGIYRDSAKEDPFEGGNSPRKWREEIHRKEVIYTNFYKGTYNQGYSFQRGGGLLGEAMVASFSTIHRVT
ncbi:glycine N-methyltransferase isoform X2 [Dromiciops gliroides]|uniref:glycine N-methyltransferase isoform X2 n=1 Tax=Dromiciops gliroides TaxID=33562 RepID=UPI001CC736A9|nr:glycine N-methyltransferase isoform X2 [Dromiciops gliroides]